MIRLLSILAFLSLVVDSSLEAQAVSRPRAGRAGAWRLIGTVHADFVRDHDVIHVVGPFDQFRKIKFFVKDAPVDISRLLVTYDNGDKQNVETRFTIPKGGESRVIDLNGYKRSIRTIEFWYDTRGRGQGRAEVTVYGIK